MSSASDVKKPAAWLDENGVVIVNTDYSQGWVRPDGAIPDSWTPLVPVEKAKPDAVEEVKPDWGSSLGQYHLDHWSDEDFAKHVPAVRTTIVTMLAEIARLRAAGSKQLNYCSNCGLQVIAPEAK